jgi:hypothetical protein
MSGRDSDSRKRKDTMLNVCGINVRVKGHLLRTARLDADKYQFVDDPVAMINGLRKCGQRIDIFTFMQRVPDSRPKYAYPMEWDNLAVLPISTYDHWWTKQLDNKTRNMVRKAEKKEVVCREVPLDDALVRGIWEIYNESPVRQGKPFSHYGKDIETVCREEATYLDSSFFIGAYFEDKLIGFLKVFCDQTRTQAGLLNIVSMIRHRDKAPTNALLAQAVRSCTERNIPYLVYSNFSYGNKEKSTLSEFKKANGFGRVDLPRYYVPLTIVGKTALRAGLHKKLTDHIPEPVLARLREFRDGWYSRRLQSAAGVS